MNKNNNVTTNELLNVYNKMKDWTANEAAHGNINLTYNDNDTVTVYETYWNSYKVFTQDQAHLLRPYLEKYHADMLMRNEYDFYNAGETWYTETETSLYVDDETTASTISEDSEVNIISIDYSLRGYGVAYIEIGGYITYLTLDELYNITLCN